MHESERIAEILGEWYEQRAQGEEVAPEEVIGAHPDLAEDLRVQFASLEVMDRLFSGIPAVSPGVAAIVGDFRLVREIGRGGMGVVYEAEQISMGRRVALKILSPSVTSGAPIERFRREARAAGRIHHTNIVPIHAMGRHGVHWYYAMELVVGRPLRDVIAEMRSDRAARSHQSGSSSSGNGNGRRRAQFIELARMFAGVAEALEASHQAGVIHRDIKPSNLLLDEDGTLKIVDFGLARLEGDGASMTLSGHLVGTPLYMSPEQARAKGIRIDHRTDIYSLGATLYEALALKPPFEGDSIDEICSQITSREPERPSRFDRRVPRDLETIVQKAMEKDRGKRYATTEAMAQDLRRFAEGLPIRARRIGPLGRAWRRVRRNPVRAALVAAVIVLAVAGGILGLLARQSAQQVEEEAQARRELEYASLCAEAEETVAVSMVHVVASEFAVEMIPGESARDLFARAIELMPDRPEAYLGRALAPGRTLEERLEDVAAARDRALPERTWRLARACFLRLAGKKDEAQRERDLAARITGATPADAYFEARWRMLNGEREAALALFTSVTRTSRRGDAIHYLALRARAFLRERSGDPEALSDWEALRTLGDRSPPLLVHTASLWRRTGNEEIAVARFEEALKEARRLDAVSAWRRLSEACRLCREWAWLLRTTEEAVRQGFSDDTIHFNHGSALLSLSRLEESLAAFDRAIEIDPTNARAHNNRGAVLGRLDRPGDALDAFDRAAALSPELAVAHGNRGATLLRLERYEDALEALDRALELDPGSVFAHGKRGATLGKLGRLEEALAAFDRALEIDPADAEARTARGSALYNLGRFEAALKAFDRALELESEEARVNLLRAWTLRRLGRHGEALKAADQVVGPNPEDVDGHLERARALRELHCLEDSLTAYDRVVKLSPEHAEAHFGRGNTLVSLNRHEDALGAFDRALELDSTHARARVNRGGCLRILGRPEEALRAFDRAIELDPTLFEARCQRGGVLLELTRYGDALQELDQALGLDSDNVLAHRARAVALWRLGRMDEALGACDQVLQLDPSNRKGVLYRADLLVRLGRLDEALIAWDRVVSLDPTSAFARINRGVILERLDRREEAVAAYEDAVTLEPGSGTYRLNLAWALIALRRLEEALAESDRALALLPNTARAHFARASVLLDMAQPKKALASLDRAVALEPANACHHRGRGDALAALGDHAEALRAYERSVALRADTHHLSGLIWILSNCPDQKLRDIRRAVELARKNAEQAPNSGSAVRNLGIAVCRSRDWKAGRAALEKAMTLKGGDTGSTRFFLALAHGHLGEKEKAREWLDKAVAWMKEHDPEDEDLKRLHAEAAELLGIGD